MERLTFEHDGKMALCCGEEDAGPCDCKFGADDCAACNPCEIEQAAIDRLAAYEETGLEPEEITTKPEGCVFYCNRKCTLDADWCAEGPGCQRELTQETAMHLLELAWAEKGGRLVVLPEVGKGDLDSFKDFLEDVFKDAAQYDPTVGIYGMRSGEIKLANALMEALRSYDALGPWNT